MVVNNDGMWIDKVGVTVKKSDAGVFEGLLAFFNEIIDNIGLMSNEGGEIIMQSLLTELGSVLKCGNLMNKIKIKKIWDIAMNKITAEGCAVFDESDALFGFFG